MKKMSTPERLRLKDSHPLAKKIEELYQHADKLGITLHFGFVCTVEDREDNTEYILEDIEAPSGSQKGNFGCFPPPLEWKITYENPRHTEEYKAELERYIKEGAERKAQMETKRNAAEMAKKKAEAKQLKTAELEELARLKRKYENKDD